MNFPKINLPVRMKNPWFWVGICGAILTAMGISPEMLNSWSALYEALINLLKNPYMLGCVSLAVLGIFIDPTTNGVGDSAQAMTYSAPKKDVE